MLSRLLRDRAWPIAAFTVLWAAVAAAGIGQAAAGHAATGEGLIFLAVWSWVIGIACYGMAMWRRRIPIEDVLDDIHAGMAEVVSTVAASTPAPQAPQQEGPRGELIQLRPRKL